MHVEIDGMKSSAYSNFTDLIQDFKIRREYERNTNAFLDPISNNIFVERVNSVPKARDTEDTSKAFLDLAKKDIVATEHIIKSCLKELNKTASRVMAFKHRFAGKTGGWKACQS